MRMIHYFGAGALLAVPALLLTMWLGLTGRSEPHVLAGLVTAILVVGVHTLVILFMLVTGRVLREGMRTRELSKEFLVELNDFFARRKAYPVALFGALSIVIAGVLGQAGPALGFSPTVHMLAGLAAVVLNLWAFTLEARALRGNQVLLDRAATELDTIDRELALRGATPDYDAPPDAGRVARSALIIAFSVWLPYFYWALVVWRGAFEKVSLHPWLELSLVALVVGGLAYRKSRGAAAGS
jgi:hypothetical protein